MGTDTSDLKVAANITLTDGELVFDAAQASNVGVGDVVVANSLSYYLSARKDSSNFMATTATGAVPTNIGSTAVTSVKRAFNDLDTLEANSGDGSHLANYNLTSAGADVSLYWPMYDDGTFDGADGSGGDFFINNYTTDATHFIKLYAPKGTSDVGVSQRHTGTEGTGVVIRPAVDPGGGYSEIISVRDDFVRVEGIELDGSGYINEGPIVGISIVNVVATGETIVNDMIMHDFINTTADDGDGSILRCVHMNSPGNLRLSNSLFYNFHQNSMNSGSSLRCLYAADGNNVTVHNVTIYDMQNSGYNQTVYGYRDGSAGTMVVRNSYCGKLVNNTSPGSETCFGSIDIQKANVSSDSTATGTNSVTLKTDYASYFVNSTATNTNLHLKDNSTTLWSTAGVDLSGDPTLPITDDIEGEARDGTGPDIGADEFLAASAAITGTTPGSLTEANLNGATVTVTLTGGTYDASLVTTDFTLGGAPTGTAIDGVVRDSATQATLTLAFDGTDFDANASLSVTVLQVALGSGVGPATTGTETVTADPSRVSWKKKNGVTSC